MKILVEFSLLVGTAIKALKQAAEMKLKLSVCILIPTLAVLYTQLNPNVWEYQKLCWTLSTYHTARQSGTAGSDILDING